MTWVRSRPGAVSELTVDSKSTPNRTRNGSKNTLKFEPGLELFFLSLMVMMVMSMMRMVMMMTLLMVMMMMKVMIVMIMLQHHRRPRPPR